MFKKILIANRGEIAIRVMRTCREMGIATAAVFSEADRKSLHVCFADEAFCIGPAPAIESYLNSDAIITAARQSGAQAIHPGYGFLSESSEFAQKCHDAGLVFIGPSACVIEQMGNKTLARKAMLAHGVPVIPGSVEALDDFEQVLEESRDIAYPLMIKAASGGGGKGMRIVNCREELHEAFLAVRREAYGAFADSRVFIEKYFPHSRHIEVQVLADSIGNVVHLFERECSIQRRYQKVIEECPSPVVDNQLRQQLTAAAIRAAQAVQYTGAGTVEFLVDENKRFYFLEMNTRIQVEHSVTEFVTGVDLVKEQIRVAAGMSLGTEQAAIVMNGWSIECRLYAEDPLNKYMPDPGVIEKLNFPEGPGVRVDSGVYEGWEVSLYYDPMIAKISTWGRNREEARLRMIRVLDECVVCGVKTNLLLLQHTLQDRRFVAGDLDTHFLQEVSRSSSEDQFEHDMAIIGAVCAMIASGKKGKNRMSHDQGLWRMASKYQFWSNRF
ncbi:MAG: acetyl-CoA carboxylase biotin carboxylase subunit [Desulfobulbaceae bacterium]|nr:acetyl-CoA carboxylase biotin carboxylase subunit [Desulfobulbaceae bacterium]